MKKVNVTKLSRMMLIFTMALFLYGSIAFAEDSLELHQIEATKSSIRVHFLTAGKEVIDDKEYEYLYRGFFRVHSDDENSKYKESGYYGYNSTAETINNGKFTVKNLDPGTRYDVKIEVSHHDKAFFYYTPTIIVATAPSSDNLTIKQIKATETSASFIVRGAGGIVNEYIIRYYPKDDKNSAIEQTFYSKENEIENEYTLEGLKPDKEYTVEITPCFRVNFIDPTVTDSEQSFLAKGTTKKFSIKQIPLMAVENLYQSKKDKNYIKVQWEPNTIADGYQVSLLDGESGNVVKSVETTKKSATIVVDKCGYYKVKVCPYVTFDGEHHFGTESETINVLTLYPEHAWDNGFEKKKPTVEKEGILLYTCKYCSATKTEQIKKIGYPSKVTVSSIKSNNGKVTLVWKKVPDVNGYMIYRKNPGSKKFTLVSTINNAKTVKWIDSKGLIKGKSYSYKIKAFKKYDNKTILSKSFSKTATVKIK